MVRAKSVLDHAAVHIMTRFHTVFGIDKKTLAADGTTNIRGQLRWLA
jgi:hypothetical protein